MKIVCALLVLAALAPTAAEARPRPCAPGDDEQVVVRSKRAVVVKKGDNFVGCRYSTGRRHLLVEIGDRYLEDASHFVLAGDKLAWVYRNGNNGGMFHDTIGVIDTRRWRGARRVRGPANNFSSDAVRVERLALSPRGWIAWRWSRYGHPPSGPVSDQFIEMNDHTGTRRLDRAPRGSLGGPRFASGSRVVWTRDGAPRSARVPSRKPCALGYGEMVVARSERVLVTKQADAWRGCRLSTGRRTVLAVDSDDPDDDHYASKFVIAGDFVAFVETSFPGHATTVGIAVADSRTWRYPERVSVGHTRASEGDTLGIEQLALSESGSVAWRSRYDNPNPHEESHTQSIGLADSAGTRVLDSGPVGSLDGPWFTTPAQVVWTRDGAERSASTDGAATARGRRAAAAARPVAANASS